MDDHENITNTRLKQINKSTPITIRETMQS
jgi:hypothetical protein